VPWPHPEAKTVVSAIAITDSEQEKLNLQDRPRQEKDEGIKLSFQTVVSRSSLELSIISQTGFLALVASTFSTEFHSMKVKCCKQAYLLDPWVTSAPTSATNN
jgi:hypothetical protein